VAGERRIVEHDVARRVASDGRLAWAEREGAAGDRTTHDRDDASVVAGEGAPAWDGPRGDLCDRAFVQADLVEADVGAEPAPVEQQAEVVGTRAVDTRGEVADARSRVLHRQLDLDYSAAVLENEMHGHAV
jgi:hypothetical protein